MDKASQLANINQDNLMINEHYTSPEINGVETSLFIQNIIHQSYELDYNMGVFDGTINLCLFHINANHREEAYRQLQTAEQMLSAYNLDDFAQLNLYRAYSIYYIEVTGDYRSAIQYSEFAMILAVKNDLKVIQMRLKSNMAVINQALGFYDIAINQLLESVNYYEINKDYSHMMYDYTNIAEAYYHSGDFKQSETYYLKAINILKDVSNPSIHLDCLAGLARTYIKLDKKYNALEILLKPGLILEGDKSTKYELNLIIALAEVYASMDERQKTFDLLIKYEGKANDVDNKTTLLEYYELLASAAGHLEKYKYAYEYMKLYTTLSKEVANINSEKAMNEVIQTEYKKNLRHLETIAEVGREITMLNDLDDVILEVTKILSASMSIDSIGIGRVNKQKIHYDYFYTEGLRIAPFIIDLEDEASLAAWCVRNNKPLIVNDVDTDSKVYTNRPLIKRIAQDALNKVDINALMYTPLKVKNEILGIFTIQSKNKFAYAKEDMEMFNIVSSYVAIALKNITQQEVLETLSITDTLTGLINRRGFTDFFSRKSLDCKSIGLLMIDLDFFKRVNDIYGHLIGDLVLQATANIIKSFQSESICVARLGGEEFGMLLLDYTLDAIKEMAEAIRLEVMKSTLSIDGFSISITISIGIAFEDSVKIVDYKNLYRQADSALYLAKTNGRNQTQIHT